MTCSPLIMTELGKRCGQYVDVGVRGGTQIRYGTTKDASEIKDALPVEVQVRKQTGGGQL